MTARVCLSWLLAHRSSDSFSTVPSMVNGGDWGCIARHSHLLCISQNFRVSLSQYMYNIISWWWQFCRNRSNVLCLTCNRSSFAIYHVLECCIVFLRIWKNISWYSEIIKKVRPHKMWYWIFEFWYWILIFWYWIFDIELFFYIEFLILNFWYWFFFLYWILILKNVILNFFFHILWIWKIFRDIQKL